MYAITIRQPLPTFARGTYYFANREEAKRVFMRIITYHGMQAAFFEERY